MIELLVLAHVLLHVFFSGLVLAALLVDEVAGGLHHALCKAVKVEGTVLRRPLAGAPSEGGSFDGEDIL